MPKTRAEKEVLLQSLEQKLAGKTVVFTQYQGLTVKEMTDLRGNLRAVGADYTVTRNSLLRKALASASIEIPSDILDVQLAVAASAKDEVEPNRVVVKFAKEHEKLQILGAIVDGAFVPESSVRALAALPSRDQLYAKVVGSVAAPLRGLVTVLGGNLRGLVSVLHQYQLTKSE